MGEKGTSELRPSGGEGGAVGGTAGVKTWQQGARLAGCVAAVGGGRGRERYWQ